MGNFDFKKYREDHKEEAKQYSKEWRKQNQLKLKKYRQSPVGRFRMHRSNAKCRGVVWELSFEEWWGIWEASGKWPERGILGHQYCMCRKGDEGPYSTNNVRIDTVSNNIKERHGTN